MHAYQQDLVVEGETGWPQWDQLHLTQAEDVVDIARADPTIGWATWPDAFSLVDRGSPCSWYKSFTGRSVRTWAADPGELVIAAEHPNAVPTVTNRWLVIESRLTCLYGEPAVTEADTAAFVTLRRRLADRGYVLLDSVVFDDQLHRWSLHELTSGTTTWPTAEAEAVW